MKKEGRKRQWIGERGGEDGSRRGGENEGPGGPKRRFALKRDRKRDSFRRGLVIYSELSRAPRTTTERKKWREGEKQDR